MEGIKIPIGAPLNQLDNDLKGAQSKLKSFASNAAQTAGVLGGSVSKGANQAGFALQNLGRVAQDAPFGFIGIQNNIIPLLESFQRLKTESGSTGGALKALTSSLVGGGGLLLGVSLVTSALTVLAQNPEKVAGALNYLSGVVESATGTQKAYNEALSENVADAKLEIVTLTNLVAIAKDENLSRDARLEALKKVKAEYPEQLNFLTLENIGSRKVAESIDLLTNSLLRKAKIQAAEKILGEAFVKQLKAQNSSITEQASTVDKLTGALLNAAGIKNTIVLNEGFKNQQKTLKETSQEINTYTNLLKKLNTEEAKGGTLFKDKVDKPAKTIAAPLVKTMGDPLGRTAIINKELNALLSNYRITEQEISHVSLVPPLGNIKNGLGALSAEFIFFNSDLAYIIDNGIAKTLSGLGDAIGNALISGSNIAEALGTSLLSSIGSVLGQLGQMAIATGVAILGIKTALKTLNPFVAIGAGVALLALSGVVKGAASKLGGGMGGNGSMSAASPGQSNQVTSSAINTPNDFGSGRVVFEISGTNLIGVLNRAGGKLQRFGP